MRLGIDFGTTRTVVCAAEGGRYPVASFEADGGYRDFIPGIAVRSARGWSYGWEAVAAASQPDAACVLRSIKRTVGAMAPDEVVPGDTGGVTALELASGFLAHVQRMIRERSNLEIGADVPLEAAVAVPANSSSRQRFSTLEAFTRAGFQVVGMINEPTAAAVEFAQRNTGVLAPRSPKRYVVVYDLGGGTFDTSAVSLEGRQFDLLATEGIARLGGDDFDRVVLDLALEAAGAGGRSLDPRTETLLLESCREAKESLRPNTRRLLVDLGEHAPGGEPVVVDTGTLYGRCRPLIDRTVGLLERIFDRLPEHAIDPEDPRELGGLYMVGGAAAFPAIARALRGRYKRKLQMAPQPHAATAVGLAIYADPEAGIFVREAVTRHFGVWREGEAGREKIFDPILAKDTAPAGDGPIVVRRTYRPAHPIGHLRFLECARLDPSGQPEGDVTPWRELRFPYDPALAERDDLEALPVERRPEPSWDEIAETYTYEPDGTVRVAIENLSRGYGRTFVLGAMR